MSAAAAAAKSADNRALAPKTRSNAHAKASPTPPRSLYAIPLLSILGGFAVHLFAVHLAPRKQLQVLSLRTAADLAARLNMSDAWPAYLRGVGASKDPDAREPVKVLLMLLVFFRDMLSSQLGKGILWLLATASMPLLLHITLETTKDGRHRLLGPLNIFLVSSIGQVFCLGAATSIISVPSHAYARYSQIKKANDALNVAKKHDGASAAVELEDVIHPLPSPGFVRSHAAAALSGLAMVTIALSIHIDTQSQAWIASNLAFQFFPLFFLPLFLPFLTASTKVPRAPAPGTTVTPRLEAARIYGLVSLLSVPLWWAGLYLSVGPLITKTRNAISVIRSMGGVVRSINFIKTFGIAVAMNVAFPLSHGEWLLIWDLVGILIALNAVVWIDAVADQWAYDLFIDRVPGYRRVHEPRFLLEDLIVGLPSALLLGPGFAGSMMFQRREHRAEKARLLQDE